MACRARFLDDSMHKWFVERMVCIGFYFRIFYYFAYDLNMVANNAPLEINKFVRGLTNNEYWVVVVVVEVEAVVG